MALQRGGALSRANPNTIQDKVLVGYQGWFTCAGDGEPIGPGHHGWLHWFNSPIPAGGRPNIDLWPDTSDYDPSELYPAPGLTTSSGDPVYLFSSRNPRTVQRHFHWMALHGVDGAFLQRFAGQCEIKPGNLGVRDLRDEIGDRVREAAEAEGRVFAIMYDVSGVAPDKIQNILEQDWAHLLRDKRILDSPSYLREQDRPVVALWGFGFNGRNHTPELVRAIAGFFRSYTPGGVYLVAGTPGHWRTSTSDADRNPEFVHVWTECFDAITPWTVGRYGNEEEADQWGQGRLKADAEYLNKLQAEGRRKVDYMPVVLPGGSGFNLSEGKWRMNDMRRNGGQFLWRQMYNAYRAGVRTVYGAMWDEYDEGTVFMPVVPSASQLPVHPSFRFLALDVDGHDLPSDWYMRILGFAAEAFHRERTLLDTFPLKELQDYWSTRPRYEAEDRGEGQHADIEAVTRAFGEWGVSGASVGTLNDVPPPYSLEDTPTRQEPPQRWPTQAIASDGPTRPPPVRQDTRPSSGHPHSLLAAGVGAVAAPLAVGIAAHTLSAGSATSSPSPTGTPPPVKKSSRPSYHASSGTGMAPPPPLSQRPLSPPVKHSSYDPHPHGRVPSIGHGGVMYSAPPAPPPSMGLQRPSPHPQGRVPSIGRADAVYSAPPGPPPPMGVQHPHLQGRIPSIGHGDAAYPAPSGPPPSMGFEHGRGRGRSHSRSKSRSRSHSRSRRHKHERSRSSSSSRKGGMSPVGHAPQMHSVHYGLHGHGHGPGPSIDAHQYPSYANVGSHGHAHHHAHGNHSHSLSPAGSPHGMTFPGGGMGVYDAYSGGQGGYTPVHSHPVGHGGPAGSGYVHGPQPNQPQGGYGYGQGYGQGQGYDAMAPPQQPGYGYTPHPSSGYYSSYGPGGGPNVGASYPGGPPGGGSSGGPMQGGIASALRAVESVAGSQARNQVERTVKSLTQTSSTFLNKLK